MVRPVTVVLVELPPTVTGVPAVDPTYGVTVYPVMAEPPLLAGAFQLTIDWALPEVATTFDGAPGTLAGVTALEVAGVLLPFAFEATIWNV